VAAVLLLIGGCGDRPRSGAAGSAATAANSIAMAPGNQLDPPALAALSKVPVAGGVPVLCYHYFRGTIAPGYALRVLGSVVLGLPALGPREFWTTPVAEFERHLRHFRDSGTAVVTLDEVADLIAAGKPLPAKAVILTIDDADQSVYRHAFPLLKKYSLRAHLFVPTAQIGRSWSGLRLCDAGQLREMAASGLVLIDSHTHDLHYKLPAAGGPRPAFLQPEGIPRERRLATSDPQAGRWAPIIADLQTSREQIVQLIGQRSPWLAWPYGFASPALDSLSLALGFRGTVSLSPRAFGPADRDLRVGRYTLTAHTTMAQITALTP
jgi:peptidoglycan/xylan/chitin deacetylase (PgdA/CDA1 family)